MFSECLFLENKMRHVFSVAVLAKESLGKSRRSSVFKLQRGGHHSFCQFLRLWHLGWFSGGFNTLKSKELPSQLACSASELVLSCLAKHCSGSNQLSFYFLNFIFFKRFKDKLETTLSCCFHFTPSVHRISKAKY